MARFVKFPGVAGSFVDTPDVNLVDADTAHLLQSIGGWSNPSNAVGTTPASPLAFGNLRRVVCDGVGVSSNQVNSADVPASTEVTVAMTVTATDAARLGGIVIGSYLGGVFVANLAFPADEVFTAGESRRLEFTVTTAAASDTLRLQWFIEDSATPDDPPPADTTVDFYDTTIVLGTSAQFVPSLRIVGDLDMESKTSMADWLSPPTEQNFISSRLGGFVGFRMYRNAANTSLWAGYGDGVSDRARERTLPVFDDDSVHTIRTTFTVGTGVWEYFADGVSFDTATGEATNPGVPAASALAVGSNAFGTGNLDGSMYYAQVRDGIDGPVVARFDAEDVPRL